jgi:hypothetical protein
LTEELEPVGFGIAAIHAEHERELVMQLVSSELQNRIF